MAHVGRTILRQISENRNVSEKVALWQVLRESPTRTAAARKLKTNLTTLATWISEYGLYQDWHLPEEKQKTLESS